MGPEFALKPVYRVLQAANSIHTNTHMQSDCDEIF